MHFILRHGKRIGTAIIGGLIVLVGLVLVPYPGPGWLIVFAGFAILATEFAFAARALEWLKIRYELWVAWLKRQHVTVQVLVLAFTGLVILVTVYLLNTFGLIDRLFGWHQEWLHSPILRK